MSHVGVRTEGKKIFFSIDTDGLKDQFGNDQPRQVFDLLMFGEQAEMVSKLLSDAVVKTKGADVHPYFKQEFGTPKVVVVIPATNDPCLGECLASWVAQTITDYSASVVIDCATDESWRLASTFNDVRFRFDLGAKLQGLTRIYNHALRDTVGDFIVLAGGDVIVPMDFLEVAIAVLAEHPEFGYVVASNATGEIEAGWSLVTTRECADSVGGIDAAYGPGGIGALLDWRHRASLKGYTPYRLGDVHVKDSGYSLFEQGPQGYDNLTLLVERHGHAVYTALMGSKLPVWRTRNDLLQRV